MARRKDIRIKKRRPARSAVPVDNAPESAEGIAGEESVRQPQKRRKKRTALRVAVRLLIVVAVLGAGFLLWRNWDTLAPEAVLDWVDEQLGGKKGDGYPVAITGSGVLQMEQVDGRLAVLTDTALLLYNDNGGELVRRSHGYTDPLLKTSGAYLLVMEQEGTRLRLETRRSTVLEMEAENKIITGAVGSDGSFALVTKSTQGYLSEVCVYNKKGEKLYRRRFADQMVVAAAFSPDGKHLAVAGLTAQDGAIKSTLNTFQLSSTDPEASYEGVGVMLMDVKYFADGSLCAVGDTALWVVKPGGEMDVRLTYEDSQILGYAVDETYVGVVYRPHGSNTGGELTAVSSTGQELFSASFQGNYRDIAGSGDTLYLLTSNQVCRAEKTGMAGTAEVPQDGLQAAVLGDKVVVLGLSSLTTYQP